MLGAGSDARHVDLTGGKMGGAYINSGTPLSARVVAASSPSPTADLKVWYFALVESVYLKIVRLEVSHSSGQLSLSQVAGVYKSGYSGVDVNTVDVVTVYGEGMTAVALASHSSASGYGASTVVYAPA